MIVIVTGPACTGKTTLAGMLAERFRLPSFHKDVLKEQMLDTACPDGDYDSRIDREFSRMLSRFSIDCLTTILEQCALNGIPAVFEANFDSRLFSPRLARIRERCSMTVVQVRMLCRGDVLTARFVEREKTDRHPGHGGLRFLDEFRQDLLRGEAEPLAMEEGDSLVTIDTTDLTAIDYGPLFELLAARLGRK